MNLAATPGANGSIAPVFYASAATVESLACLLVLTLLVIRRPLCRATRIQPGPALRYQ